MHQNHVVLITSDPKSPDRTAPRIPALAQADNSAYAEYWKRNHAITAAALDEDFAIAEGIEASLSSGATLQLTFAHSKAHWPPLRGRWMTRSLQRAKLLAMVDAPLDPRFHPPAGGLVPHMGITFVDEGEGWLEARMAITQNHLRSGAKALHAASMIALADSVCGFAAGQVLPDGAKGYTTIELKSNFIGTASEGSLIGRAEAEHLGRTTQVWKSNVTHEQSGRTLALFCCTQMILY